MQTQLENHPDTSQAWIKPAAASSGVTNSSSPLAPATPAASPTMSPWHTTVAALPCGSLILTQAPLGSQSLAASSGSQSLGTCHTACSTSSLCPICSASSMSHSSPADPELSCPVGSCTLSPVSSGTYFNNSGQQEVCGPLGAGAAAAAAAAQPCQLGSGPSQVPPQHSCSPDYPAVPPNSTLSLPPPSTHAEPGPQVVAQPAAAAQGVAQMPGCLTENAGSFLGSASTEHGLTPSPFALGSSAPYQEAGASYGGPSVFLKPQQANSPQQEAFACAIVQRGASSYYTASYPPRTLSKAQTFAKVYKKELGKELKRIDPKKMGKAGKLASGMLTNPCGCIFVGVAIIGVALFFPIKAAVKTWRKVAGIREGSAAPLPSGQPPPQQVQLGYAPQLQGGSGSGFSSYDGAPITGGLPVVQEGYMQLKGHQE